jgi:pimeloyl-ACP methyl ester carboxylesterase
MWWMRRKSWSRKVFFVVLGIVGIYLLLCVVLARNYIYPARRVPIKPEWLREVVIDSRFGPTPAWGTSGLVDGHPSRVVFVMAHGYGGSRDTWTDPIQALSAKGFDCLAIAMPGQDASPARGVGFGISEGHAIVDAVKWTRFKTGGKSKIVVLGLSMGGAATWLATAEDPQIDGIVTEGAYGRFDLATKRFFDCKVAGGSVMLAPVVTIAKWMSGIDPEEVRPVDAAAKWRGKPALVIQGGADVLITPDQGKSLADAAGCEEWIVPGAEHAHCYETDSHGYIERICHFAEALSPTPVK